MALQLRRGSNAQRLGMTPANGELIYVVDADMTTITVSAINTSTNYLTLSSGAVAADQQIKFIDDSQNGLVNNQVYFALAVGNTSVPFQVSLSQGGSPVDITGSLVAPIQFAETPTLANGAPVGTSVARLWIGDGVTVGGTVASAINLDDLLDVQIGGAGGVAIANYQHLQYDSADQLWRNVSNVVVPGTLNVFGNTTLGDASGDTLTFNASTVATPNNLNFDSGLLFIDATNNRIGINDATPSQALDVGGNGQFSGAIYVNNTDNSTSAFSGAIQTPGGIGLAKDIFVGGAGYITGTGFIGGNTTLNNGTVLTNSGNVFLFNTVATTVDAFEAATTINIGAATGTTTIQHNLKVASVISTDDTRNATNTTDGSIQTDGGVSVVKDIFVGGLGTITGDLAVNGGDLTTTAGTATVFNTTATTLNIGGAATTMSIGNSAGTVTIPGNLTVNGTTTTINSQTLLVADKNIEMGVVAVPTDTTADGGGIILKGTTDKSILYDNALGAWVANIGFNTPGSTLGNITVGVVDDNTISTTSGDLVIQAAGTSGVQIYSNATAPTYITRTSTGTNTAIRTLTISAQSTGTPAAGFGNSLEYEIETAVGNTERAGYVSVISTDVTPTSEDFTMNFGLMTAGATADTKMTLNNAGDLEIDGDLTVTGNNIKSSSATALTLSGDDVTVVGDLGVGGGTVASSQTTVNLFNTTTTTLNIGGAATTVAIGAATGTTTIGNDLVVNGNTTLGSNQSDTVTVNGLVTDNIIFSFNDTATPRGILGQMSTSLADYWFIGGAETGGTSNDGYAMIATGDDGNDEIYVRQYTGSPLSGTVNRELTLLDASGNTLIPNNLSTNGDLFVENNKNVYVSGQSLVLNNNDTAGANVELVSYRGVGGASSTSIRWNETSDRWQTTVDGSTFLNIPNQNLDSTDSVAFGAVAIDARADIDTATLTTTAITQVPLTTSTRNVMKCVVYIVQGTDVHTVEALVLRTGASTAMVTTYGEMYNTSSLATFAADTSGGAIRLLVTPANTTSMLFTSVITSLT